MKEYIYHYTHLGAAISIAQSGYLNLSQWEIDNGIDPPALWLSIHPLWEYTATKMKKDANVNILPLTFSEQHEVFGCVRFVLPFESQNLLSWDAYKKAVRNTERPMLEAMERKGISLGAQPRDWYASLKNISVDKIISCQIWDGGNWQSFEIEELKKDLNQ